MNVVRHYYECMHLNFAAILKQAMIKNQGSCFFWNDEFVPCTEADEIRSTVLLDVGKISSIESAHRRVRYISTLKELWTAAAPGCAEGSLGTQARAPALHVIRR